MAGIDLSQSVQESQAVEEKSSDRGFWAALGLFVLLLVVWGGLKAGTAFINGQIDDTLARTQDARDRMKGDDVNRIADFYTRADLTSKALTSKVLPEEQFRMLETTVLPGVRFVAYDYDVVAGSVKAKAATGEFRQVAQQLARLRSASVVSDVRAGQAAKEKDDSVADAASTEIVFDFELTFRNAGSGEE